MEREYEKKTFLTLLTLEKESCGETSSKYFADDPCPVRIRDTQQIRLFQDNDKNLRIEGFTESSDNVLHVSN